MKAKNYITIILLALAAMTAGAQDAEITAFPGAEGFGRYASGGRGGEICHVTSLRDDGSEGTLRWAVEKEGRKIVVFDVSGTIFLNSKLDITANTTIAGQSAPGDGICVADYPVSVVGDNVIIRYMRFRPGNRKLRGSRGGSWDGFSVMGCDNVIIDHCSVSWSIDECLSVLGNRNTTVQWCIVAQSLVNAGHPKGAHGYGGNWGGSGASFHHNLVAHHTSRTPRLGPNMRTQRDERMDMRNNVIYNWGDNGCYGGEGMTVNIVNNYYKPGPATPDDVRGRRIAAVNIRTTEYCTNKRRGGWNGWYPMWHVWGKFFVEGNVNDRYPEVTADNWENGFYNQISPEANDGTYTRETRDTIRLKEPMPYAPVTTHTAEQAYELVLSKAGASLHRDALDWQVVEDTRNGTATFTGDGLRPGFVNTQDDNRPENATEEWTAWPQLRTAQAPADTDRDGMPDEWERANALNPSDPSDASAVSENGYTNIEVYLNALAD